MIEGLVLPVSCFEEDGLLSVDDKSIDHIITDPPYEEHVHADNRRSQGKNGTIYTPQMLFDHLSDEERWCAAQEFVRVCRGWILVFCSLEQAGLWVHDLVQAGAKRRTTLTWTKTNCAPKFQGDGAAQGCEVIVTAWAGRGKSIWNCGGMNGTYPAMAERIGRRHPTQKPLSLMRQLVADFTQPGQLILDPYAGGGQTLVAAKNLRRRYAGYELDTNVALDAQEAIERAESTVVMLPRMNKVKLAAFQKQAAQLKMTPEELWQLREYEKYGHKRVA